MDTRSRRDAFLAELPPYLGMGVLEGPVEVDEYGTCNVRYTWAGRTIARVYADAALGGWRILDFGPNGTRASTSEGRTFMTAAQYYGRAVMGEEQPGTLCDWLGERLLPAAVSVLFITPPPGVQVVYVPACAVIRLLAAMDAGAPAPVLSLGEVTGNAIEPMPLGPRLHPSVVLQDAQGTITEREEIALAEYVVTAIDAPGAIVELFNAPNVLRKIPVIAFLMTLEYEHAIAYRTFEDGSRVLLDTGPVDPRLAG